MGILANVLERFPVCWAFSPLGGNAAFTCYWKLGPKIYESYLHKASYWLIMILPKWDTLLQRVSKSEISDLPSIDQHLGLTLCFCLHLFQEHVILN